MCHDFGNKVLSPNPLSLPSPTQPQLSTDDTCQVFPNKTPLTKTLNMQDLIQLWILSKIISDQDGTEKPLKLKYV